MGVAEPDVEAMRIVAIIFLAIYVPPAIVFQIMFWRRRHLHPIKGNHCLC
jgi:hypothetical protein